VGRDLGDVVVLAFALLLLELEGDAADGPRWMRFIRWVVKPEILSRSCLEGTTACSIIGPNKQGAPLYTGCVRRGTHDFIDDMLVGVEVEGQAGVAGEQRSACAHPAPFLTSITHYFSTRTQEALLVVLVRTRP
jgi:hypothetical protein